MAVIVAVVVPVIIPVIVAVMVIERTEALGRAGAWGRDGVLSAALWACRADGAAERSAELQLRLAAAGDMGAGLDAA